MPELWNLSIQDRNIQSSRVLKLQSSLLLDLQVKARLESFRVLQRDRLPRPPSHTKLLACNAISQRFDDVDVSPDLGLCTHDHSSKVLPDANDDWGPERKISEANEKLPPRQHQLCDCLDWNRDVECDNCDSYGTDCQRHWNRLPISQDHLDRSESSQVLGQKNR